MHWLIVGAIALGAGAGTTAHGSADRGCCGRRRICGLGPDEAWAFSAAGEAFSRPSHPSPAPHRRFLSLLGNPPCVRLPIKPRLAVERAFGREFNSVGALFSDKALDGFHVADHDRPLAKIDQAPAMPVLEDLVNAFPAAARHVAELAL